MICDHRQGREPLGEKKEHAHQKVIKSRNSMSFNLSYFVFNFGLKSRRARRALSSA